MGNEKKRGSIPGRWTSSSSSLCVGVFFFFLFFFCSALTPHTKRGETCEMVIVRSSYCVCSSRKVSVHKLLVLLLLLLRLSP